MSINCDKQIYFSRNWEKITRNKCECKDLEENYCNNSLLSCGSYNSLTDNSHSDTIEEIDINEITPKKNNDLPKKKILKKIFCCFTSEVN